MALAYFSLVPALGSEVAPDSLILSCPCNTPDGFSWAIFFCQDVTNHCTLAGSADSPLFVCQDHSAPSLFGSVHGVGDLGFRWFNVNNSGVLARGIASNCQTSCVFVRSPRRSPRRCRISGRVLALIDGHASFLVLINRGANP